MLSDLDDPLPDAGAFDAQCASVGGRVHAGKSATTGGGRALFATAHAAKGEIIFRESPALILQDAGNRPGARACARCHSTLRGAPNETVCARGCGEGYCDERCAVAHVHEGSHSLMCVGPLDSWEHPLAALKLDEPMSGETFDKKLLEVVASRGRKGTDARELLAALEALAGKAKRSFGYARELGALMHLIAAQFDANRTIDDYMDVATWRSCHGQLGRVVAVLSAHPGVSLGSIDDDDFADMHVAHALAKKKKGEDEDEEEEDEKPEAAAAPNDDPDAVKVVGNLLTFLARLEDEYVKSLQRINPHTHEYVSRLRDEAPLTDLAAGVQAYYVRVGDDKAAATVALLRVEHMYYKHESIANAVRAAQAFRAKWGHSGDVHPASRKAEKAGAEIGRASCRERV